MKSLFKTENLSVIHNLGKSFETPAILDVNIEIYQGEYIIIFGPSGCGKSTLLFCLAGLQPATKGKVYFQNELLDINNPVQIVRHRRFNIGMVFQFYNLIPTLKVLDNVMLPHFLGRSEKVEKKSKEMAYLCLSKFNIENLAHRYPGELSGGQQQRVAIARSLMYNPPVLLADEPVGNLDSTSAKIVMNSFSDLNQKDKKTIILVTHDPQYLYLANRIFHMKDGKLVRIEFNPEKQQFIPVSELKELINASLRDISKRFPNLTEIQLKAKALAQHLITNFSLPEQERLENILEKRIKGDISEKKLEKLLDVNFESGGLGLYQQSAKKFVKDTENILSQAEFLEHRIPSQPTKSEHKIKAEQIRKYLLDAYEGDMETEEQIQRLDNFIDQRIQKKITKVQFEKYLDLPLKQNGVGLNSRTAKNFAKRLEVVLTQA